MSARITKVYLLSTPLENDYKHTLYFNSREGQIDYFKSKIVHSFEDFSYQRKEGYIRVPKGYDELTNCNYIMYQNSAYSGKWFFAFITEIKYISDDVSHIYFETDCIQTWYFDYEVKPSFVEREHVLDDTIGLHTVPEGLERGEYVINAHLRDSNLRNNLKLVMGSTEAPGGEGADYGAIYNGVYSGVMYYTLSASDMSDALQYLADHSKIDAVTSVFYAPGFLIDVGAGGPTVVNSNEAKSYELGVSPITSLNGYVPKNKKLLTYPYCYLLGSNGNGGNAIYHQEKFTSKNSDGDFVFRVYGALTPGCSIRMVPINYNGTEVNTDEGINLGKYPQCNWATDMYTNWLTQNGVNVATNIVSDAVQTGLGVAMMSAPGGQVAGGTMALSGASGIINSANQVYLASLIPPQTYGNINCGDVITSMKENTFHLYRMTIKQEYAKIIDGIFNMFGYKVNEVKVPNVHHRARYWYTKTIDVNIDGPVPMKDIEVIKNAYNNGITFWRNGNEIGNYALDNYISNIV